MSTPPSDRDVRMCRRNRRKPYRKAVVEFEAARKHFFAMTRAKFMHTRIRRVSEVMLREYPTWISNAGLGDGVSDHLADLVSKAQKAASEVFDHAHSEKRRLRIATTEAYSEMKVQKRLLQLQRLVEDGPASLESAARQELEFESLARLPGCDRCCSETYVCGRQCAQARWACSIASEVARRASEIPSLPPRQC